MRLLEWHSLGHWVGVIRWLRDRRRLHRWHAGLAWEMSIDLLVLMLRRCLLVGSGWDGSHVRACRLARPIRLHRAVLV